MAAAGCLDLFDFSQAFEALLRSEVRLMRPFIGSALCLGFSRAVIGVCGEPGGSAVVGGGGGPKT